jgi:hypothetical protein
MPSPVPRTAPPFGPKPEKMTPSNASSVVSGPGNGISMAPGILSKFTRLAVIGGG